MSELVKSAWRVVHGSTVLLDYGDLTSEEFGSASWQKDVDVLPMVQASNVSIFDRGGLRYDMSIDRVTAHASAREAREWAFAHSIALGALGVADLTITLQNSFSATLRNASVTNGGWAMGKRHRIRANYAATSYAIVGEKLEMNA